MRRRFLKIIFLDLSRGLSRLFVISRDIFFQDIFFCLAFFFRRYVVFSFRNNARRKEELTKRQAKRQNSKETPSEKTKSATQKEKKCFKWIFFTLHFFSRFFSCLSFAWRNSLLRLFAWRYLIFSRGVFSSGILSFILEQKEVTRNGTNHPPYPGTAALGSDAGLMLPVIQQKDRTLGRLIFYIYE